MNLVLPLSNISFAALFSFKRHYDTFLMKYQELAKEKGWGQPLVGMAYIFPCTLILYFS
jgi:hypothetical protein